MKKHIPFRMCIVCKGRYEKQKLHRFQIKNSQIITKVEFGRSLYICDLCLEEDDKKLQKSLMKICKNNSFCGIKQQELKEIFFNGRCKD